MSVVGSGKWVRAERGKGNHIECEGGWTGWTRVFHFGAVLDNR